MKYKVYTLKLKVLGPPYMYSLDGKTTEPIFTNFLATFFAPVSTCLPDFVKRTALESSIGSLQPRDFAAASPAVGAAGGSAGSGTPGDFLAFEVDSLVVPQGLRGRQGPPPHQGWNLLHANLVMFGFGRFPPSPANVTF